MSLIFHFRHNGCASSQTQGEASPFPAFLGAMSAGLVETAKCCSQKGQKTRCELKQNSPEH
jgi:hypothetical protein